MDTFMIPFVFLLTVFHKNKKKKKKIECQKSAQRKTSFANRLKSW